MEFLRRNTDRPAKITLPGPFTMGQQAKNEFYRDDEEMVMDFAAAVNAGGARPAEGRRRRHPARRAVGAQQSGGGQAPRRQGDQPRAAGHHRPDRGAHLLRLRGGGAGRQQAAPATPSCRSSPTASPSRSRSKSAQPKIDLGVLKELARKKVMLGVLDLGDLTVETPAQVAERIRAGLEIPAARQADPGARLRHEIPAARRRLRQAQGARRRRRDRAPGDFVSARTAP